MKRTKWALGLLVLVLMVALVTVLAGCGDDGETATTAAPATTATTAGPTTTAAQQTTTTAAPTTTTAAGVPDTGQTYDLKFSYGVPQQASLYAGYLLPMAEDITEATEGRVKIEHYPDGTLAKDDQQYDALTSGTCDMAMIEPEYTTGVFPVFEVGSLPGMFPDPAVAAATMWDVAQEYCADELKDVKLLAVAVISGSQYIGNKEIKVPADLAGVKMRSGGKVENWLLSELGAEPVDIMLGDLPTSMERGLADGAFLSWSLIMSSGVKDYTKYRSHLDLMYRPWLVVMNKDVWESMPITLQDAIAEVTGQMPSVIYSIVNEEVTMGARKGLEGSDKGAGNPAIYEPTAEEKALWIESSLPVWQKWTEEFSASKSPFAADGQAILDFITGKVTEYEGLYEQHKAEAEALKPAQQEH